MSSLVGTERRRCELNAAVAAALTAARGLHGSPRLHADLHAAGRRVSRKTVATLRGLQKPAHLVRGFFADPT